jgi:hypothetical protein
MKASIVVIDGEESIRLIPIRFFAAEGRDLILGSHEYMRLTE